ncbi:Oxalate decarboxylase OxdC [Fusarium oxysporum f. sp. albedinis]|nr:Oxalate decarboxylase OxdC [Fusarium oxysporum f. sp. albedinis]
MSPHCVQTRPFSCLSLCEACHSKTQGSQSSCRSTNRNATSSNASHGTAQERDIIQLRRHLRNISPL